MSFSQTFKKALPFDSQTFLPPTIPIGRSPAIPRFDRSVILIVAVDGLTGIKGLCLNKSQAFPGGKSHTGVKKDDVFLTFSWRQRDTKGKPLLRYLKFDAYKYSSKIVRSILIIYGPGTVLDQI